MTTEREQLEQAAQDLDSAADVIDARGWCGNALLHPDGRVCAEGALIAAVAGEQALENEAKRSASEWGVMGYSNGIAAWLKSGPLPNGVPGTYEAFMERLAEADPVLWMNSAARAQAAMILLFEYVSNHDPDAGHFSSVHGWNDRKIGNPVAGRDAVTDSIRMAAKWAREQVQQ